MTETSPDPAAWGLSAPLEPIGAGARNAVYRCADTVLKSTRRSEASLRWLGPVHAAARRAGLIVPEPMRTNGGHLVHEGWTAERFLPGPLATRRDLAALGVSMSRLHDLTRHLPARPDMPGMAEILTTGKGGDLDLSQMPSDLVDEVLAAFSAVKDSETGAIHGDLNPGNVILTESGPALTDWDESRRDALFFDHAALNKPVTAAQSRAALAWEIACCWQIEPQRARRLARGFTRSAGSAPIP